MDCGPRCYCSKFPRQSGSALRLIFNMNSFVCNSAIITSAQPHYRLNTNTLNSDIKYKTSSLLSDLTRIQSALSANKEASHFFKMQQESHNVVHCLCPLCQDVKDPGSRHTRHTGLIKLSYMRHWHLMALTLGWP